MKKQLIKSWSAIIGPDDITKKEKSLPHIKPEVVWVVESEEPVSP